MNNWICSNIRWLRISELIIVTNHQSIAKRRKHSARRTWKDHRPPLRMKLPHTTTIFVVGFRTISWFGVWYDPAQKKPPWTLLEMSRIWSPHSRPLLSGTPTNLGVMHMATGELVELNFFVLREGVDVNLTTVSRQAEAFSQERNIPRNQKWVYAFFSKVEGSSSHDWTPIR
jgi:hypothetical protein